ncbi:MAG: hypothetical protein ABH887_01590 [bacterium]
MCQEEHHHNRDEKQYKDNFDPDKLRDVHTLVYKENKLTAYSNTNEKIFNMLCSFKAVKLIVNFLGVFGMKFNHDFKCRSSDSAAVFTRKTIKSKQLPIIKNDRTTNEQLSICS